MSCILAGLSLAFQVAQRHDANIVLCVLTSWGLTDRCSWDEILEVYPQRDPDSAWEQGIMPLGNVDVHKYFRYGLPNVQPFQRRPAPGTVRLQGHCPEVMNSSEELRLLNNIMNCMFQALWPVHNRDITSKSLVETCV